MAKTSANKTDNFDRFVQVMSRVLGISRKRLDKILLQGIEPPRSRRRSSVRRTQ
jgi:hypothetical protein